MKGQGLTGGDTVACEKEVVNVSDSHISLVIWTAENMISC